jgi:hypothetical protein
MAKVKLTGAAFQKFKHHRGFAAVAVSGSALDREAIEETESVYVVTPDELEVALDLDGLRAKAAVYDQIAAIMAPKKDDPAPEDIPNDNLL